jgi:hypothetical protein
VKNWQVIPVLSISYIYFAHTVNNLFLEKLRLPFQTFKKISLSNKQNHFDRLLRQKIVQKDQILLCSPEKRCPIFLHCAACHSSANKTYRVENVFLQSGQEHFCGLEYYCGNLNWIVFCAFAENIICRCLLSSTISVIGLTFLTIFKT